MSAGVWLAAESAQLAEMRGTVDALQSEVSSSTVVIGWSKPF